MNDMQNKTTIGTDFLAYNQRRNFIDLPFKKYQFQRSVNAFHLPARLKSKLGIHDYYLWHRHYPVDFNKIKLFHFFNTLSTGKMPWISTFETALPRWGRTRRLNTLEDFDPNKDNEMIKKGLALLARPTCKKIIAISNCTQHIQSSLIQEHFPSYYDTIRGKLLVLHPSQATYSKELRTHLDTDIVFTFIGDDFFRKGGKEVLIAFDLLTETGWEGWKLNIISKLKIGDYASLSTEADLAFVQSILDKHASKIKHYAGIDNTQVMAIVKATDVGLLPTYADTYGYSVLELQSAGCPVITSNVRALPEINNDDMGWVIKLPKDQLGNAYLATKVERERISSLLRTGLIDILEEIKENRSIVRVKGAKALENIKRNHSKGQRAAFLEGLYDEILLSA